MARYLNPLGKEPIRIAEGEETDQFWQAVGGRGTYATEVQLEEPVAPMPRLFHCCTVGGRLVTEEIFHFGQKDLSEEDMMLLDVGSEVFVWLGRKVSSQNLKDAIRMGTDFLETDQMGRKPDTTPVTVVQQSYEPVTFTSYFHYWERHLWDEGAASFEAIQKDVCGKRESILSEDSQGAGNTSQRTSVGEVPPPSTSQGGHQLDTQPEITETSSAANLVEPKEEGTATAEKGSPLQTEGENAAMDKEEGNHSEVLPVGTQPETSLPSSSEEKGKPDVAVDLVDGEVKTTATAGGGDVTASSQCEDQQLQTSPTFGNDAMTGSSIENDDSPTSRPAPTVVVETLPASNEDKLLGEKVDSDKAPIDAAGQDVVDDLPTNHSPGIAQLSGIVNCLSTSTIDVLNMKASTTSLLGGDDGNLSGMLTDLNSALHSRLESVTDLTPGSESTFGTEQVQAGSSGSATPKSSKQAASMGAVLEETLIDVHTDSGKCYSVAVTRRTTAQHLVYKMVEKTKAKLNINLCIVEMIPSLSLERQLEDHEKIVTLTRNWPNGGDNRLVLRNNPSKYALWEKPLLPQETLQAFCEDGIVPDMASFLWKKSQTDQSWHENMFVLRRDGIVIGDLDSPGGLRHNLDQKPCFASFLEHNLYEPYGDNHANQGPTQHCLFLKPPSSNSRANVKSLCANSGQEFTHWMAGMRLMKYGSQLKTNFNTVRKQFLSLAKLKKEKREQQQASRS